MATRLFCILAVAFAEAATSAAAQTPLTVRLVASGFERPLYVTSPPGDPRLFVVEQVEARIWIVRDGAVLPEPFLDIDDRVNSGGGERGLLGLAFHPDYAENGYFFVNYTDNGNPGDTVVARYRVSANPDAADPGSEQVVLRVAQPFANHNGGMLAFGPGDGYLYIASGDGGSGNDPGNRGQSLDTLLGKILRIDVDSAVPYAVPPSNPFVGHGGALGEIWAYGLRNPWRFSFDRLLGDLYIGDVGQSAREEIDVQPGGSSGGENYGWRIAEGFACLGGSGACGTQPGLTPPVHDYGRAEGGSVTGGCVYRGEAVPGLRGTYLFGDFVSGRVWSFRYAPEGLSEFTERTQELDPPGAPAIDNVASFGEDADGELYIVDYDGEIWKIVPAVSVPADLNADGRFDAADVQLVINGVLGRPVSVDPDIDDDGRIDAMDVQLVINAVLGRV